MLQWLSKDGGLLMTIIRQVAILSFSVTLFCFACSREVPKAGLTEKVTQELIPVSSDGNHALGQMEVELNMPELEPEEVLAAIIDFDPVPEFESRLKEQFPKYRISLKNHFKKIGFPPLTDLEIKAAAFKGSWDIGFRKVTGYDLNILHPEEFMVKSGAGRHWIVTKAVMLEDDNPAFWCVPVVPKPGEETKIVFDGSNIIDFRLNYLDFISNIETPDNRDKNIDTK
jgi:hypothetical protein